MARTPKRQLAMLLAIATALSACENFPKPFTQNDNSAEGPITTEAAKSVRLVDRDVEAPEIFQTTGSALWDGRPSLGGVWVASPDAVNPERVILRNEANGKFVIGALFRRERDNPGPKLQISSDAAEALGLLAGQPGKLNVTALRREDSQSEVAPADPVSETQTLTEPADVELATDPSAPKTAALDPLAAAGAALDRADGTESAEPALEPTASDDLDPTPRPGETKRAARKRARAAAKAAAAAELAGPSIEDGLAQDGALAAPVAALDVAPLPEAQTEPAIEPKPSAGSNRIQIGFFSVEANAQKAVDTLKAGGVAADIRKDESNGKTYWSVVATGSADRKALLAKVKALGFVDAYPVSG